MSKTPAQRRPGWSFVAVLLAAAVLGIVGGVLLGFLHEPELSESELAVHNAALLVRPVDAPGPAVDPMAPDPISLAGIPPYPKAAARRLLHNASAHGGPMSVSWFSSDDTPEQILNFYAEAFAADQREVVSQRFSKDLGYVGWLERVADAGLAGGVLHMVSAIKQHAQTIVLVSASRPDLALQHTQTLPDGLALPPASSEPQVMHLGEGDSSHEVIYAATPNASTEQVLTFFRQHLKAQGFSVGDSALRPEDASSLSASRGATQVAIDARTQGLNTSFVVTYERRGEP